MIVMTALRWLWSKIGAYALAAGALAAAVAYIFTQGRKDGQNAEITRQRKAVDEKRQEFDAIEGQRPDFDAAIGRLRGRSEAGDRDPG
jgi:hypothetical protein